MKVSIPDPLEQWYKLVEYKFFFLTFFLIFIYLFSLYIEHVVRFNTNFIVHHFVHNSTFPSFNLSIFTEEDGTTVNNVYRNGKSTQFCNF